MRNTLKSGNVISANATPIIPLVISSFPCSCFCGFALCRLNAPIMMLVIPATVISVSSIVLMLVIVGIIVWFSMLCPFCCV